MKRRWIVRVTRIALIGALAIGVFGFVTMGLWNWLMPALFGWRLIGFWQALGLVVLSKILFGGFHRHEGRGGHWRRRMFERWEQMTPEERDRLRSGIHRGCGFGGSPKAEPTA